MTKTFQEIKEIEDRLNKKASHYEKLRRDFTSPKDSPIDNWLEIAVICSVIFGLGALALDILQALL